MLSYQENAIGINFMQKTVFCEIQQVIINGFSKKLTKFTSDFQAKNIQFVQFGNLKRQKQNFSKRKTNTKFKEL